MEAFRCTTDRSFGNLIFDLHPASSDDHRLWTNTFPFQEYPSIFVPVTGS